MSVLADLCGARSHARQIERSRNLGWNDLWPTLALGGLVLAASLIGVALAAAAARWGKP